MSRTAILRMIQICDSLFPIGTFTLSNGLESFVLSQKLKTNEQLEEYVESYIKIMPYNDLGVMILAYKNALDIDYLKKLDTISMALKNPMEIRNGTVRLCSRFFKTWENKNDLPALSKYEEMVKTERCQGNHAIAVGLFAFDYKVDIYEASLIYAYSQITAIVTNSVKLVPLSQKYGQSLLAKIQKELEKYVEYAQKINMEDLGTGGVQFDIEAMNHEILYSRLYMS